jgi:6-pyruvoyltetrahydropterin/6-carboxytetrahydropterin synthase
MGVTTIQREVQFDTAHRVPLHESKCRHLHGHRYRVVAHVSGPLQESGPATGMVVDFGDLKRWLTEEVHDRLDHGCVFQATDFDARNLFDYLDQDQPVVWLEGPPTAENIAAWCWERLDTRIAAGWGHTGMELARLDVWETPTCCASITR